MKKGRLKERHKQYQEWTHKPHEVEALSAEQHVCVNCKMHYEGNFCPRCGQSAKVGRYSFKTAFLLFLDVWGLGNRGMLRTLRDLLLRPGYLIRDYLKGMQMSYFPPFKMFFLLCALALLVDSGLNIRFENRYAQKQKAVTVKLSEREADPVEEQESVVSTETEKERKQKAAIEDFNGKFKRIFDWMNEHISVVTLLFLLLFSCPLWLLFRHSPTIPDLRLSECFIAMVYISNMLLLYSLVPSFFCFNTRAEGVYGMLTLLLINIPIKQLTGYGYWSTIWRVFLAATSLVIVLGALIVFSIYLYIILVYA